MSLTLDDGTEVSLTIPPGAVPFATEIAVTPATLNGWDFAPTDFVAVDLAPDGLELLVPGLLNFKLPSETSPAASGQVAWGAGGTDLHPALGTANADGATLSIDHFSGYGFGWNLDMGYWGAWEQWRARSWQAYIESQLATLLGLERQKQLISGGEESGLDLTEALIGLLDNWYDWVYSSFMASAGTGCDNAIAAANAQITMGKQLQQMGLNIHDVWTQFVAERQKRGLPTPYSFDGLSADFAKQLVETCDRDALQACLLTGDLGLLLRYVGERNRILDLSAQPVIGVGNGLDLIERCAQYRVEFDVTFLHDFTSEDVGGPPRWELLHKWHTRLTVDLRWMQFAQEDGNPVIGRLVGAAIPEIAGLLAEVRHFEAYGTDQGTVAVGWEPWCPITEQVPPWPPWPLQLMDLDFNRERDQRELPPLPWWIARPPQAGPTYKYESRLITTSFETATIKFDVLPYNMGEFSYTCGDHSASGPTAAWFEQIVEAQSPDTTWAMVETGLSETQVNLLEHGEERVIARRQWPHSSKTTERLEEFDHYTQVVEWEGTLTLTHTAPLS
ncbi:MAG TPA: hypothetical protein VJQ57_12155 [Acidimicrobiia bacterium]|nr:hypothetical protein [Acidimicrobiia bacterium]